ncbi:hypothetical protein BE20_11500 [Sorangium cellulosum]|nr:hypothetical protein BE20_11500 [Sorangium cellulosum]
MRARSVWRIHRFSKAAATGSGGSSPRWATNHGAVKRTAQIGYRRRAAWAAFPEQEQGKATLTEHDVVHLVPDEEGAYRIGVPTGSRTYELHGLPLGEEGVLAFQTFLDAADDATGPLPFGEVGTRALPYESYAKILTPSLITSFGASVTSGVLAEGGYLQLSGDRRSVRQHVAGGL